MRCMRLLFAGRAGWGGAQKGGEAGEELLPGHGQARMAPWVGR